MKNNYVASFKVMNANRIISYLTQSSFTFQLARMHIDAEEHMQYVFIKLSGAQDINTFEAAMITRGQTPAIKIHFQGNSNDKPLPWPMPVHSIIYQ